MLSNLKQQGQRLLDVILYLYNWIVAKLIEYDDKQRRINQLRWEEADSTTFLGKFKDYSSLLYYYLTPKKLSLQEQKELVSTMLTSVKHENSVLEPFDLMSKRKDVRLVVKLKSAQVLQLLNEDSLDVALRKVEIIDEEYVTLIEVAKGTANYERAYEQIIESLDDKLKRRSAFLIIMIQPFLALGISGFIEVYVSLFTIDELASYVEPGQEPPIVKSYLNLQDILLHRKLEYTIYVLTVLVPLYFFVRLQASRFLIDYILLNMPIIGKYIMNWEISKFFNSLSDLLEAGSTTRRAMVTSVGLISNRVIRASLIKDIEAVSLDSNNISDILGNSVYVNLKIRNQLRIAKESNSDSLDVLRNIVEEYKDTMKKLLEVPMGLILPIMMAVGGAYIFMRLIPLYNEINNMMLNIS